jgi:hypothetical protein
MRKIVQKCLGYMPRAFLALGIVAGLTLGVLGGGIGMFLAFAGAAAIAAATMEFILHEELKEEVFRTVERSVRMLADLKFNITVSVDASRSAPKGFLIDLLMPPERAEDALVNILRRYDVWVEKYGDRTARVVFTTQSFGVILSFYTEWLLRRIKLLELLRRS